MLLNVYCFSDSGFDSDIDSLLNGNSISSSSDVYQKLKVDDSVNFIYSEFACFNCQFLASMLNECSSCYINTSFLGRQFIIYRIFQVSHNSILTPKSQDNGSGKYYVL